MLFLFVLNQSDYVLLHSNRQNLESNLFWKAIADLILRLMCCFAIIAKNKKTVVTISIQTFLSVNNIGSSVKGYITFLLDETDR